MPNLRGLSISILLLALAAPAMAQTHPVAPPPQPPDAAKGPSLEETMKFIQDKLNGQGRVGYVYMVSNLKGINYRYYYVISDAQADAATCTLKLKETINLVIDPDAGTNYTEGGNQVTGDDLHRTLVETSTTPLRKVVSLTVQPLEEAANTNNARAAHPEITVQVNPPVFNLTLTAGDKDVQFHVESTRGKGKPSVGDNTGNSNSFTFQEEGLADRVAKAITHAVELCGGGSKDPF
jgi:hypothetical protein